ncbi:MAG: hypothetical protein QM765_27585 [Myxococcales bacterium]
MGLFDLFRKKTSLSLARLAPILDTLEANRVMARLYLGSGRSEAHGLIERELAEAAHRKLGFDGYCFADEFSLGSLEQQGALLLCFGAAQPQHTFRATWTAQVQVGEQVAKILKAAGLQVDWSGEPGLAIAVAGSGWEGPREKTGVTGARLPLDRQPNVAKPPPMINVFVGGPVPGDLGHRLLAELARRHGTQPFGPADGTSNAAVDFERQGRLFDLVSGANGAGLPMGPYLLRTREPRRPVPRAPRRGRDRRFTSWALVVGLAVPRRPAEGGAFGTGGADRRCQDGPARRGAGAAAGGAGRPAGSFAALTRAAAAKERATGRGTSRTC